MAEPITIPDLENGKIDIDTLADIVNLQEETTVTRLSGPVKTWYGVMQDLAVSGGLAYKTLAELQAITGTQGQVAEVTNDGDNNGRYRWNGTEWERSDGVLNVKQVNFSPNTTVMETEDGLVITDEHDFSSVRLGSRDSNINGLFIQQSSEPGLKIVDWQGFVIMRADESGLGFVSQQNTPAPVVPEDGSLEKNYQIRTDVMGIFVYGQSLARGVWSVPAISTTQPHQNLMMASGVLVRPSGGTYNASSFVPLVEAAIGNEGETECSSICNSLVDRVIADGETASDYRFFSGAMGEGGLRVQQLAEGTARFADLKQLISDANDLCASQGQTFSVWAMPWIQGESDNSVTAGSLDRKSFDYIVRLLNRLWMPLKKHIMQTTGQTFSPIICSYQVPGHRKSGSDTMNIAKAHWRLSKMHDDYVLAVPGYIFPVVASDNQHLTNEGSWLMGQYMSRAIYHTMYRRAGKWRPLEPVSVDWDGTQIDIDFHVPAGHLVIDDALCATYENAGFVMRDGSDAVIDIIDSVAVTGKNTVRVTLSEAAPADAVLTYGRGKPGDSATSGPVTGPRGNLRDTHGDFDQVTSPLDNTFQLHNPCVYFEYSRKTGF